MRTHTPFGLQRKKESMATFSVGVIEECFLIIAASSNMNPIHVD